MPTGYFCFGQVTYDEPPKVGRPRRDRSKNKAQRQARKRRR